MFVLPIPSHERTPEKDIYIYITSTLKLHWNDYQFITTTLKRKSSY